MKVLNHFRSRNQSRPRNRVITKYDLDMFYVAGGTGPRHSRNPTRRSAPRGRSSTDPTRPVSLMPSRRRLRQGRSQPLTSAHIRHRWRRCELTTIHPSCGWQCAVSDEPSRLEAAHRLRVVTPASSDPPSDSHVDCAAAMSLRPSVRRIPARNTSWTVRYGPSAAGVDLPIAALLPTTRAWMTRVIRASLSAHRSGPLVGVSYLADQVISNGVQERLPHPCPADPIVPAGVDRASTTSPIHAGAPYL